MCLPFCLRIIFALFSAYVSCLGSYEGNMPTTNMQRVLAHTFPVIGSEVKVRNRIDSASSSVHLPHTQDSYRHYSSYQTERLSEESNLGSESKDCLKTPTESDNQDNTINKLSANYKFLGFGQPSSRYESRTATHDFRHVEPVKLLANTSSQGGSKTFKPSRGESSYVAPTSSTAESSKSFNFMALKPQVSRDALVGGPNQVQSNPISSQVLYDHSSSRGRQSIGKVKAASSTHSPVPMVPPVHLSNNPRKPSHSRLEYAEVKPSVVSSGAIFVLQGNEITQGSSNKNLKYQKPLGVSSNVDLSQTSSVALNVDCQPSKSWNDPPYFVRGGQYSAGPKPQKMSGSECKDGVCKYSIASSGGILFRAHQSVEGSKPNEGVRHPENVQKTYNNHLFQSGSPVFSVSGSQPNLIKPTHPSGAQFNMAKSSIVSSGAICVVPGPVSAQSKTQSYKLQVTSEPHASLPKNGVMFPSDHTALQYQPSKANQNSGDVQSTTGTYARPTQSGYQVSSSFVGTSYNPGSAPSNPLSDSRFSAKKNISDTNEINAMRVRLNKLPTGSFGNLQNQWVSGDNIGALSANSGNLPSFMRSSHLGQRYEHVQTPVRSSVSQYHATKEVQSLKNSDSTSHEITTIPSEFGKGVIRRLSPMISSSYITASQNQELHKTNQRVDFSPSGCEVTQNHPTGLGQQSPGNFQRVKHSSRSTSQSLL